MPLLMQPNCDKSNTNLVDSGLLLAVGVECREPADGVPVEDRPVGYNQKGRDQKTNCIYLGHELEAA